MEEHKHKAEEKKNEVKVDAKHPHEQSHEHQEIKGEKQEEVKIEGRNAEEIKSGDIKVEEKKDDLKEKQETKKGVKKEVKHPKKTEAFALGASLPISTKHSKEISRFISGKNPEEALELLEKAGAMKIVIPFRGEIPHRRGKGMMSGRYPITAIGYFIRVLKSAIANASLHNVNVSNSKIHAIADMASRPYKRFGSERFKRTNIKIIIKEFEEKPKLEIKQNGGAKESKVV